MPVDYKAVVTADNGTTVNLRQGPSTSTSVQKAVRVGTIVDVTEEYNGEWAKVKTDGLTGYMMRKFLRETADSVSEQVTITLDYDLAAALLAALRSVVKE